MNLRQKITNRLQGEITRRKELLVGAVLTPELKARLAGIIQGISMALDIIDTIKD